MASWGIAELKAKATEVVESAQTKGPQEITRHGKRVSPEKWEKPTLHAGRQCPDHV